MFDQPVLTAQIFQELDGGSAATSHRIITQLEEPGIIREVTGRKRDRVWVIADVVDELSDLDKRIQARVLA